MKKTHILLLIVVSVVTAIIISTYSDSSSYATFVEAEKLSSLIHVVGQCDKNKEIVYNPIKDPNYFSFTMQDKNGENRVVIYHAPKPIDFERADQIVVVGKINDGVFEASKILLKCPSKYTESKT